MAKSDSPNSVCGHVYFCGILPFLSFSVALKGSVCLTTCLFDELSWCIKSQWQNRCTTKTHCLYHQDFCLGTIYFNSLQKLTLEKQGLPIVLPHGGTHSNRGPTATKELWKPLPYTEWRARISKVKAIIDYGGHIMYHGN